MAVTFVSYLYDSKALVDWLPYICLLSAWQLCLGGLTTSLLWAYKGKFTVFRGFSSSDTLCVELHFIQDTKRILSGVRWWQKSVVYFLTCAGSGGKTPRSGLQTGESLQKDDQGQWTFLQPLVTVTCISIGHVYSWDQKALRADSGLLNEGKEGVQCMLVKFFARKAAWLDYNISTKGWCGYAERRKECVCWRFER